MKTNPSILIATLAIATLANASAATFFDDFSSYSGSANTDATWQSRYSNTSTGVTFSANGLNSSTAVNIAVDETFVRKDTVFDLSAGAVTASIFFQFQSSSFATPQLGFVGADNGNFIGSSDLSGRLTTGDVLQLRSNNGASSTGSALTLTAGNWYQLEYTLTRTATSNTFSSVVSLYNATSAGVVGSQVGTLSNAAIVNPNLYPDSTVYFALRKLSTISGLDNLSVTQVPEPYSATLGCIGMMGLLIRRRK